MIIKYTCTIKLDNCILLSTAQFMNHHQSDHLCYRCSLHLFYAIFLTAKHTKKKGWKSINIYHEHIASHIGYNEFWHLMSEGMKIYVMTKMQNSFFTHNSYVIFVKSNKPWRKSIKTLENMFIAFSFIYGGKSLYMWNIIISDMGTAFILIDKKQQWYNLTKALWW